MTCFTQTSARSVSAGTPPLPQVRLQPLHPRHLALKIPNRALQIGISEPAPRRQPRHRPVIRLRLRLQHHVIRRTPQNREIPRLRAQKEMPRLVRLIQSHLVARRKLILDRIIPVIVQSEQTATLTRSQSPQQLLPTSIQPRQGPQNLPLPGLRIQLPQTGLRSRPRIHPVRIQLQAPYRHMPGLPRHHQARPIRRPQMCDQDIPRRVLIAMNHQISTWRPLAMPQSQKPDPTNLPLRTSCRRQQSRTQRPRQKYPTANSAGHGRTCNQYWPSSHDGNSCTRPSSNPFPAQSAPASPPGHGTPRKYSSPQHVSDG